MSGSELAEELRGATACLNTELCQVCGGVGSGKDCRHLMDLMRRAAEALEGSGNWRSPAYPPKDPEETVLCRVSGRRGRTVYKEAPALCLYRDGVWIFDEDWEEVRPLRVTRWLPIPE